MACESDGRLKRGRARRELLLDAAVAVIASGGARQLTHRAVASQAGVSLASVTYHFPSIADLRSAAFGHAGSRVGFAFRDLFEANRDDLSRVPQLAGAHVASLVGPGRQDTVAVFEMILAASHDDALKPVIRELEGHLADLLTPYVGDRNIALTVGASIQGLILSHLARGDSTDTGGLHDAVADLVGRYGTTHYRHY